MAEAVARRWHEPDHGIWEERHAPRHHVYSKVMCWVTLDRAVRLAETYGRDVDPSWPVLRDTIAGDVLKHGWSEEAQSFTTAYDGDDLDAASLHVGLSGLIDPADDRFQATVTAIEAELRSGSTVYRYRRDDGLPGDEGGFHLCAAWMIESYLLTGRRTASSPTVSDRPVRCGRRCDFALPQWSRRRRQHPHQEDHEPDARTRRIRPPPPPHPPTLTDAQRHHRLQVRAARLV
ncbi:GH15 family glucan-1,4-alpha-glucosidase [Saccharothrix longispora]|uniref:GH15 family glucan-1,4-alpha-glucosidase n=1 Tax=Saccharothrix longispora TaxID=33920 RepID=A0ABU1PTK7_9PSEU|nr:GH15 family glucan-1,4-alpha-glucosidase [Saccharothrix longispora]